ncbi:calcium-binding protein [Microvirga vignae]|uniref:calcium-binding protein n=1 Tax=Microvirga vignae TaxID=1225564 RepID=UPI00069C4ABB|nr:calcium-binding protein [Microvirga vignae]
MAIFQAFNAAGVGFNMSGTNPSGWSFVSANPYIETVMTYDDGFVADFDVFGSSLIDAYSVWYASNGYDIVIDDLLYENYGNAVLSIKNLNLYTTVEDLYAYDWYVALNRGHDTFYGNDYADVIRGGYGNDLIYSYGGHDTLFGDAGNDKLYGLIGDDDLYGGTGRDLVNGGSGSDYLSGGLDIDTLTGSTGRDYFVFDSTASIYNVDTITDFTPADDTIMLDNAIFTRVGPNGWLSGAAFRVGRAAADSTDRIIYNKETGALLYDQDGYGGYGAVKVAQLKAWLPVTKYDFYVL